MKKLACFLLALALLAGLSFAVAAEPILPDVTMELDEPVYLEWAGAGYAGAFLFYPAQSGWYVFEGSHSPGVDALTVVGVSHVEGDINQALGEHGRLLLYNKAGTQFLASAYTSATRIAYLEAGAQYVVSGLALTDGGGAGLPADTFPLVARRAVLTGKGNVSPQNITIKLNGEPANFLDVFPAAVPYDLLRLEILGDALGQGFKGVKAGTSTLVFYDWEGNEVGRSTVTVNAPPPNLIPGTNREATILNWILYIVFFGWIWMR